MGIFVIILPKLVTICVKQNILDKKSLSYTILKVVENISVFKQNNPAKFRAVSLKGGV